MDLLNNYIQELYIFVNGRIRIDNSNMSSPLSEIKDNLSEPIRPSKCIQQMYVMLHSTIIAFQSLSLVHPPHSTQLQCKTTFTV